jgi:hypothetical protein
LQRESLAELADKRRIHGERIGLLALLKGPDERSGENVFRLNFITGHVKRKGKGTMTVAFVHVALPLLARLFGSLGDDEIRFSRKLAFKV